MRAARLARPPVHPFKATWSGQSTPSHRRSSSSASSFLFGFETPSSDGTPRGACLSRQVSEARGASDRQRSGGCVAPLLLLPLLTAAGVLVAAWGSLGPDPCSNLEDFELVSVRRRESSGESSVVGVPLPDFHFGAFRGLAGEDFEVRRGSGPNDVKFRPRKAATGLTGSQRTWTRGRLVGSVTEPRLGRQRFALSADLPEGCRRGDGDDFAGHLVIFTAFRKAYDDNALSRVGRWWLKDGNQFGNATAGLGLALRESYLVSDPGLDLGRVRQQLWNACGDSSRFPKVL